MAYDDLNRDIRERTVRNSEFSGMVDAALVRRRFGRWLAELRKRDNRITQAHVARLMKTTQANVSRLERGEDVRLSTLQRYADAIGYRIHVQLRARRPKKSGPRTAIHLKLAA